MGLKGRVERVNTRKQAVFSAPSALKVSRIGIGRINPDMATVDRAIRIDKTRGYILPADAQVYGKVLLWDDQEGSEASLRVAYPKGVSTERQRECGKISSERKD